MPSHRRVLFIASIAIVASAFLGRRDLQDLLQVGLALSAPLLQFAHGNLKTLEMELLVDLMPDDTTVLVLDPERARSRAHDLVATAEPEVVVPKLTAETGSHLLRRRLLPMPASVPVNFLSVR